MHKSNHWKRRRWMNACIKEASGKAQILAEAFPYIQAFSKQLIAAKLGGSFMENHSQRERVLTDIAIMQQVGMKPIVVHGGGPAINQRMKERGKETVKIKGLRYTDEDTMKIVDEVLSEINSELVNILRRQGARTWGISGQEIFVAQKVELAGDDRTPLDLGFVGEPDKVRLEPLQTMFDSGVIPVISPVGRLRDGRLCNMNADKAAIAVAKAFKVRKLVFLSDVPGLLRDPGDANSLISTLRINEVKPLIRQGIISGGMLPKVESAVEAILSGVGKVHMIDGGLPHALLLELFTQAGIGTEMIA